jgi:hypothetical protein
MIIKTVWPSIMSRQIEQKNRTETTASANQCVYGANITQWERISKNVMVQLDVHLQKNEF